MNKLLADIPGVLVHVDDILVYAETRGVHDQRLHEVLKKTIIKITVIFP